MYVCVILTFGICRLEAQGAEAGKPVDLEWAFVLSSGGAAGKVLDVASPPALHSGDRLRLYLEPSSPLFLYVVLLDSSKRLSVLHPDEYDLKTTGAKIIPAADEWFVVDEVRGTEEFTILASVERLDGLERLLKDLEKKPDADTQARVIEYIKELRRSRGGNTTGAEKGVLFAGTFQTRSGEGITGNAVLARVEGFYAKTLRLRHE